MADDLSRCIERAARESGVDAATAARIEDYFRDQWGGKCFYLRKARMQREHKAVALSKAVASGGSVAEACAEAGISRSAFYRLRKKARAGAIGKSDVST